MRNLFVAFFGQSIARVNEHCDSSLLSRRIVDVACAPVPAVRMHTRVHAAAPLSAGAFFLARAVAAPLRSARQFASRFGARRVNECKAIEI